MKTMKKDLTLLAAAVSILIFGCCLLVVSLILPPPGEIDHSVLVAFGEILTFAGALLGVRTFGCANSK